MENQSMKLPIWYWVIAIIFLLWNLIGVGSFFAQSLMTDDMLQALPPAEQELYKSYPLWTFIAFAIAVFGGLIGSIGLIMRAKWAKTAFIVSLVALIPQMIYNIFFTNTAEVYGSSSLLMPVMIIVSGVFLVWYSGYCIRKGWLK